MGRVGRGRGTGWGTALDFFHAKVYLREEETAHVSGMKAGADTSADERIDATITSFNLSHGYNALTICVLHRWALDAPLRPSPYVGAGGGWTIPHVEVTLAGERREEYQFAGPVVQAFAGVRFTIVGPLGLFVEAKGSYAWIEARVPHGTIEFEPLSGHVVVGLSLKI
jgi:lipid A oxidase